MVIIYLSIGVPQAIAQDSPRENAPTARPAASSDFEALKRMGSGRVDQVIDGLTVTLKEDKIIRLAGIDIPGFGHEGSDNALLAFDALKKILLENEDIVLYQTRSAKRGRTNRMGQTLAHIKTKDNDLWVQGALLSLGLARAMPTQTNPELAREMLALEHQARLEKKGIWAPESAWRLRTPADLHDHIGSVQVVEGTVVNAASVRNNLYLNFGEDWRTDFTVRMPTSLRKDFARAGIDPLALSGQTIRVRGYLEEYNGPMITLENIHLLEIVDALDQSAVSP